MGKEENNQDGNGEPDVERSIEEGQIVAIVGNQRAPEVLFQVVSEDQAVQKSAANMAPPVAPCISTLRLDAATSRDCSPDVLR